MIGVEKLVSLKPFVPYYRGSRSGGGVFRGALKWISMMPRDVSLSEAGLAPASRTAVRVEIPALFLRKKTAVQRKSFLHRVQSNQIQNLFTFFRLIWHQIEFHLDPKFVVCLKFRTKKL